MIDQQFRNFLNITSSIIPFFQKYSGLQSKIIITLFVCFYLERLCLFKRDSFVYQRTILSIYFHLFGHIRTLESIDYVKSIEYKQITLSRLIYYIVNISV